MRRQNLLWPPASVAFVVMAACASFAEDRSVEPTKTTGAPFRWQMTRHPGNPLLRARPGTWEAAWFVVESVIRVDRKLYLYYCGARAGGNKTSSLGLAVSDDGAKWQRHPDNPIWPYKHWDHFLRDVRVHRLGPTDFWMIYSDGDQHLDLARSADGIRWHNDDRSPILKPSQSWEHYVMQPRILRTDDRWLMWYSTYGRKPRVTGYATSRDGIRWDKYGKNPVLPLGKPGAWDDYSAFQPFVFRQDGRFHMIYNGSSRRSPTGYRWGYAWSSDGIAWTKSPDNPIFVPGSKGAWDGGKVSCPTLVRTGPDTFDIYYCGAQAPAATYLGIGLVRARLAKPTSQR